MSEQLPDGGIELSPADIEALDARWSSCWTPNDVARRLSGTATPWYVAAGWAIDLFRGTQTRAHGDIEIAIPAASFPQVRSRFPGYVFDAVSSGRIWENATPDVLAATHQTWLRDAATGNYLLDVFREPHDGDTWICRRNETIRLPYATSSATPGTASRTWRPSWSCCSRPSTPGRKDQADFDATVPHLTPAQRETLAGLLARTHPGHPWLADL